MDWSITIAAGTLLLAIIGGQFQLSNFINTRFSKSYDRMDKLKEDILSKLEYHERHDDQRFEGIRRDLFAIQLRNASIDARDHRWRDRNQRNYLPKEKIESD